MDLEKIILRKVKVHNLKSVDLELPPNQFIVFTGVSGSGKSSLAFDTIYAEGQRRYLESLSTFARRHLGDLKKPEADSISGISPTIAIEQKTVSKNPRSTIGTITGIYDYLRVLYARVGIPHCPISGEPVKPQSLNQILDQIKKLPVSSRLLILSPYARNKKGEFKDDFNDLLRKGFTRVRLDGDIIEISDSIQVDGSKTHDVDIIIDRLSLDEENFPRLAEAVSQALDISQGLVYILNHDTKEEYFYSQHAFSQKSQKSYPPLEPQDFSFNHPVGMCQKCQGLGTLKEFDLEKIINPDLSISEDCCSIGGSYNTVKWGNIYDNLARIYKFSVNTPWKKISKEAQNIFLYGADKKWIRMEFKHPSKNSHWTDYVSWQGVIHEAHLKIQEAKSETYHRNMQELMTEMICPSCNGARINPYPAATLLGNKKIYEVTKLSIGECLDFFSELILSPKEFQIADELLKEIKERLSFLKDVGLHYITLERQAPTLSGGEAQRVRLASQIGSGLVGATYVLDEPSIGLHPRDSHRLLNSLKKLRDLGNTIIVVEHDEETIAEADYIVDVGPLAGALGGEIIAKGSLKELLQSKESLTGAYLSGKMKIEIPKKRRPLTKNFLKIEGASHHNLKNLTIRFPLEVLIAVTGVSGSGKSSLISDTLHPYLSNKLHKAKLPVGKHKSFLGIEHIDKVISIDQSPIGRTPRSNAATYIKLFDDIRTLFSELPESQAHGFKAGRFSFNVKEGSCPHCGGMGMTKVDMDFMEDEWVTCKHCEGRRFDQKTLSVTYKGKSIHDILEMSVEEALNFFDSIPSIKRKLQTLSDVGLNYLRIGQPSPTISGGEAQRIKLAKELSRPDTGHTLYILDEPTTGLHFHDINKLITILQKLVDKKNTVLVIEHNMDLVKTADWIIDLGPEGGEAGGQLIAEGSPEKIAKMDTATGVVLRKALNPESLLDKPPSNYRSEPITSIKIKGAAQNNLKHVNVEIPRGAITVCTGPSGSGKTSLAFDTVYAEGQRRYIESLSAYARQFVKQMQKPKIESIEGLSPAIAIEQKSHAGNPRSTIGTMTEVYDFLRVLYAHLGTAYCPDTNQKIESITKEYVLAQLFSLPEKSKLYILSPISHRKGESFGELKARFLAQGFLRLRLNNQYYELDEEIPYDPKKKNEVFLVIDRLVVQSESRKRIYDALEQADKISSGTIVVDVEGKDLFFNLAFAVPSTGKSYPPITPHTFSFNTEHGMCPECNGLGFLWGVDFSHHPEILSHTPTTLLKFLFKGFLYGDALDNIIELLEEDNIIPSLPIYQLSLEKRMILFHGSADSYKLKKTGLRARWIGLNPFFSKAAKVLSGEAKDIVTSLMNTMSCPACHGSRLTPIARNVLINDVSLPTLCDMALAEAYEFIHSLDISKKPFLKEILEQLLHRLHFLNAIGLSYLSLGRSAPSLSGGETQRIRLARQLGSGLTGCLYVLDEPTIGLHPHNNELLNQALKKLRDLGNTLLLVEHDPHTLQIADYLLDFGPQGGDKGGKVIARGTLTEIKSNPESLTGLYLSKKKSIPIPATRRTFSKTLDIKNASLHNLKSIDVSIPVGVITCVTGVSGSGKSTLIEDLLKPALEKALQNHEIPSEVRFLNTTVSGIDSFNKLLNLTQSPIGHTNRADISTYSDALTPLRHFFAALPQAEIRGLLPKNFSFNHIKGMCTNCWGHGTKTIQLQFLPPVRVECDSCHGFRLNPLALEVKYKGKHLGQVLNMTVEEAKEWLPPIPKIVRILDTLISVGLGYLKLNQEIATLSGGEAQRLRLSKELSKRSTGKTIYLLDEPTVGLHSDDIVKLLEIFHNLANKGNTLVLVEHNLDVIANADYIIDLGPDAGKYGGEIVTQGPPEEVAQHPSSYTAKYLKDYLGKPPSAAKKTAKKPQKPKP